MARTARLSMRGIQKSFGPVTALAEVSLDVAPGEIHALVGENGAGKSTLMNILAGVTTPDAGSMVMNGRDYAPRSPMEARLAGVAMIHQELALSLHQSVEDNLLLGREPVSFGLVQRAARRPAIRKILDRLKLHHVDPETRTMDLSPGARQLVEIARALLDGASVVVMDEPTSSLSRQDALNLFEVTRDLAKEGCAIIWISHFMDELRAIAHRYTVLRDGRSVGSGAMEDIRDSELVELMAGRPVSRRTTHSVTPLGEVLLEARDLQGHPPFDHAGFELRRGEVVGITGLVGAGRTELLRALFGLDPIRSGAIKIGGHVVATSDGPKRRWALGAGLVSEDRKGEGLMLDRSVAMNMVLSKPESVCQAGWLSPRRMEAAAQVWMEQLGIRASGALASLRSLSGGNQQKVALARLLHHDADLFLLDEPTRGIDVRSKQAIWEHIRALASKGKAILVIGSHLPELLEGCDRIAVMRKGRLLPFRPVAEWTEASILAEATAGTGARDD